MKLKPATFKHIEAELYGYHETKKEIQRRREEIMNPFDENPEQINVVKGPNSVREPGRPTERMATRLMSDIKLRNLEEIVSAIDSTYNQVSSGHRKVIEKGYWDRQGRTWAEVADFCHVHRNTLRKYRHEIVTLIAVKIGWQ